MPIKKGSKRTWAAGRPRFTSGEVVRRLITLSREQNDFLEQQDNASAFIRRLLDREMAKQRRQRTQQLAAPRGIRYRPPAPQGLGGA
jgi:hypothetical protein